MAKRVTRWQAETEDAAVFETEAAAIAHEMEKGPLYDQIVQFVTANSPTNSKYHDTQINLILKWEAKKKEEEAAQHQASPLDSPALEREMLGDVKVAQGAERV